MILSPYDPDWPSEFAALQAVYAAALGELVIAIEHVGSTAVPGLAAKPILDVDVVMPDYTVFPGIVAAFDRLGYIHCGDQGIFQREAFKAKPGTAAPVVTSPRPWMPHHLYVCPAHGAELRRHLRFRDVLRARADLRREYEEIKRGIASRSGNDRKTYARIKETECRGFVERVLREEPRSAPQAQAAVVP